MNKLFYCCKQKTFDCKAGNVNESAYVSISAIALYVGVYVCICEYAEYVSGFFEFVYPCWTVFILKAMKIFCKI